MQLYSFTCLVWILTDFSQSSSTNPIWSSKLPTQTNKNRDEKDKGDDELVKKMIMMMKSLITVAREDEMKKKREIQRKSWNSAGT